MYVCIYIYYIYIYIYIYKKTWAEIHLWFNTELPFWFWDYTISMEGLIGTLK